MNYSPSVNIEEILRESKDNYEKALKSGIKLQEDTINLWKGVMQKLGSPEELKAKLEELSAEVVPAARKQLEEVVETLSRTSEQVLSLSEKTVSVYKAPTLPEAQHRFRDLTESYFAAARENLKILFDANARVIGNWSDLAGRFMPAAKLKAKLEELSAELLPAAHKQLEEVVETLSKTSVQLITLSEKTFSVYKAPTLAEAQHRFEDLTESYFAAARENLKIAFDANARVTGNWSDLAGRFLPATK